MDSAVKTLELRQMLTPESWERIAANLMKPWTEEACALDMWFDSTKTAREYRQRWGKGAKFVRAFIKRFDVAEIPPKKTTRDEAPVKPGLVKVVRFPGGESMWVETIEGDQCSGYGRITNEPVCSDLEHGDLVAYEKIDGLKHPMFMAVVDRSTQQPSKAVRDRSETGPGPVQVNLVHEVKPGQDQNSTRSNSGPRPVRDRFGTAQEDPTRISYICSSTKNNISPNSDKFGSISLQKAIDELKKSVETLLERVKSNFKTRGINWYLTDNKRKATLAACRKKGQSFADVEAVLLWWTTSNHPTACYLREGKYGLSTLFRPSKFPAYLELAQDEQAVQVATPDRRTMTDEEEALAMAALEELGVLDAP